MKSLPMEKVRPFHFVENFIKVREPADFFYLLSMLEYAYPDVKNRDKLLLIAVYRQVGVKSFTTKVCRLPK